MNNYKKLINMDALNKFRSRALNPMKPNTRGTAENDDIYFQNTEVRNKYYEEVIDHVCYYMNKINKRQISSSLSRSSLSLKIKKITPRSKSSSSPMLPPRRPLSPESPKEGLFSFSHSAISQDF